MHAPLSTRAPRPAAIPANCRTSRVLPIPASPPTSTVVAWPASARPRAASSSASSSRRPTKRGLETRVRIGAIVADERSPCRRERPQSAAQLAARRLRPAGRRRLGRRPHQIVAASCANIRLTQPLCHAGLAQVVQGVHFLISEFDEVSFGPHPPPPHLETSLFRAVSLP